MGLPSTKRKRGRPRHDTLAQRIIEGLRSNGRNKCPYCGIVLPRSKSLIAHKRTHTREKPYICDFPDCNRAFSQTGNLKTHLWTHTLENHFVCAQEGCGERFRHSNRKCKKHKHLPVIKDLKGVVRTDFHNLSEEKVLWIKKYTANPSNGSSAIIDPSVEESHSSSSSSRNENLYDIREYDAALGLINLNHFSPKTGFH